MKYDFTSIIDRHGMDSIAVDSWGEIPGMAPNAPDEGFDRIPMWVADMNFATVPTVQERIIQRAQHPMFGYFDPRPEYFDRIIEWQSRRNGVEGLRPEHIGYENGVLGGVVSTLRAYVQPGDAVLVHSPTYIGFTKSIEAAGYHIVHSPLVKDENNVYRMDFEDMEKKIMEIKDKYSIPLQPLSVCGFSCSTDALSGTIQGRGVAGATLTIPRRYSHSPVELMNINDALAMLELLLHFVTE